MGGSWYKRTHDLESIGRMVELLAEAANALDGVGEHMPHVARGGPFAKEVEGLTRGVAAQALVESMRMRLVGVAMLDALQVYARGRATNLAAIDAVAENLEDLERD